MRSNQNRHYSGHCRFEILLTESHSLLFVSFVRFKNDFYSFFADFQIIKTTHKLLRIICLDFGTKAIIKSWFYWENSNVVFFQNIKLHRNKWSMNFNIRWSSFNMNFTPFQYQCFSCFLFVHLCFIIKNVSD